MSYDLAVFDPRKELQERAVFDDWYDERTEWEEELDFNEPSNATPSLQAWFHEMRLTFAPMNGPYQGKIEDEPTADYTICSDLIYVAFSWSDVEKAYELCFKLAQRHRVGFLDASGEEGAAWFPSASGALEIIHRAPAEDADA